MDDNTMSSVDNILLRIGECFVYSLPPRRTHHGHFCKSWNLEKPIWQGQLHVVATQGGSELCLRFTNDDETLFAQSKAIDLLSLDEDKPLSKFIEPALDSSRCFVTAILDPNSGRRVHIGFGFRERSDSFDFHASIQDHQRQIQRHSGGATPTNESTSDEKSDEKIDDIVGDLNDLSMSSAQKSDKLSIKDGEVLQLKGGFMKNFKSTRHQKSGKSTDKIGLFSLPPPPDDSPTASPLPSCKSIDSDRKQPVFDDLIKTNPAATDDFDEWSDFHEA
eukprot:157085_1